MAVVKTPSLSLVMTPRVWVRRALRLRAIALGRYPRPAATAEILARVSSLTSGDSLSALDTVPCETPATRATSFTVTRCSDAEPCWVPRRLRGAGTGWPACSVTPATIAAETVFVSDLCRRCFATREHT